MGKYAKQALVTLRRWEDNPPTLKKPWATEPEVTEATYFREESPESDEAGEKKPKDSTVMKKLLALTEN